MMTRLFIVVRFVGFRFLSHRSKSISNIEQWAIVMTPMYPIGNEISIPLFLQVGYITTHSSCVYTFVIPQYVPLVTLTIPPLQINTTLEMSTKRDSPPDSEADLSMADSVMEMTNDLDLIMDGLPPDLRPQKTASGDIVGGDETLWSASEFRLL